MKYRDRDGNEISREEWARLCAVPHYSDIRSTEDRQLGYAVETVWIGLDVDRFPEIFMTQGFLLSKDEAIPFKDPEWATTLEESMDDHGHLVNRLVAKLKKGK